MVAEPHILHRKTQLAIATRYESLEMRRGRQDWLDHHLEGGSSQHVGKICDHAVMRLHKRVIN